MVENFPNLGREMHIQIHKAEQSNRLNSKKKKKKKATSRHIRVELTVRSQKQKTLKAGEKWLFTSKWASIRLQVDFIAGTWQASSWMIYSQYWKKQYVNQEYYT